MTRIGSNILKGVTAAVAICLGLLVMPAVAQVELSDHLQRGQAALADGLHGIAEEHFQAYFKMLEGEASDNVKPVILLVRALHGQKKYAEARSTSIRTTVTCCACSVPCSSDRIARKKPNPR